ncbi:MAG: ABC transporter substrate-binding protein [Gammaproteobacteria bacterium]|nr:ABC transporter substrate-binding protein [Gammaproteobacteria bacterium]MBQ0839705.1 ABC transporter substrate-binding protein [Gammaproteobacteria bacterium]
MVAKLLQTKLAVLALCWAGLMFAGQAQASCTAPVATADEAAISPYQLIATVTDEVLAEIDRHRAERDDSAEEALKEQQFDCFVAQVDRILDKVVAFDWIALKVMGGYGKAASAEQKAQFAEAFRNGLVDTYGRGLLSYSSEKIVLLPEEEIGDKRKITVRQQIVGAEATYPLEYTMGLKDGQWKVLNVVINGINLGKTFRGQFTQSSQKNAGDIDKVIASWDSGINNG